jgi:hypothetical protein
MFKSKRRLELEKAEDELYTLKNEIREIMYWCAADSPEIGFAMRRLLGEDEYRDGISYWRDKLRKGKFTWEEYVK